MPNRGWFWKPKGAASSGLLYEPGNWGDILKDAWIWAVARWLQSVSGAGFSCLDPLAGLPSYPLPPKSLERLRLCGLRQFEAACAPFLEQGLWPSAASLVADLPGDPPVTVFDKHAERRKVWSECGRFETAEAESGYELLATHRPGAGGLIVIDPYDFLGEWRTQLAPVLAAAEQTTAVVYIYNRSVRGQERLRDYVDFRNALEAGWSGRPKLLGRVPSDSFLPTAHHEVLFLPCGAAREAEGFAELWEELTGMAHAVDETIRRRGAVESFP